MPFTHTSRESYWAEGRTRETQDALIDGAARVVGLYYEGEQVGFSRAISDGHVQSYLADVYVLEGHRGRGLGVELVRFSVDEGPLAADQVVPAHGRRPRPVPQVRIHGAERPRARATRASSPASVSSSPWRACPARTPVRRRSGFSPGRASRGRGS